MTVTPTSVVGSEQGLSDALGSRAWGQRTNGVLAFGDQLTLVRQAVVAQLAGLPSQVRARLGRTRAADSALLCGRRPPDSRLAAEARELVSECSQPALLAHCLRCWLFADLFAQLDDVRFDPELLYLSCVLHDLALTDEHRASPWDLVGCFAVHGGDVAARYLVEHGAERPLAEAVAQAITLHMNIVVPLELGAEAHLLHAAAHLDVAGTRAGDLPAPTLEEVLAAHPRDGFAVHFAQQIRREATERPRSRAALLWRSGMPLAIKLNPLDHVA